MKQHKGVFLLAAGAAVVLAAILLFGRARPAQDPPLTAESFAQETVGQLLEELKRSDGAYTEDCFAALAQRLLEKPEDTLRLLQEDPQMQEVKFATLVLWPGPRAILPPRGGGKSRPAGVFAVPAAGTASWGVGHFAPDPLGRGRGRPIK